MTNDKRDDRERSIDDNLRKVFDETLEQGVPDRFKSLLEQLRKQDADQETSK